MSKCYPICSKILIFLLCHKVFNINATTTNRIVGGQVTTISTTKYIVSLRQPNGYFFCGGSLIHRRYVLTAAHCVDELKPNEFNVHGGATYLRQIGVKRSVAKIIMPKRYNPNNFALDVAVLKLSRPMQGNNIAPIALCSQKMLANQWVRVSGWGLLDEDGKRPSQQLRTVNVRLISKRSCQASYRGRLTRTMMCASIPGRKDSCSGDSGGPLVHRGRLCGIVSFGIGCAREKYPGVYTSVNQVKRFIINAMRNY